MTKIDIFSGFLGAGKTTLIKKLLKEALSDSKVVLIENEFGEIGIDGGFLKESGIEIKEMNSGCICCSLVGDFGTSLKEVLSTYAPERILIEPSGVGKLSDVVKAVDDVAKDMDVEVNSAVAVVDATKCKMYIKNFGEFFCNQIACAGTIILSRTQNMSEDKLKICMDMIREYNKEATIITTPWEELKGEDILKTIEGADKLEDMIQALLAEEHHHDHHHHDDDEDECCHDHHHDMMMRDTIMMRRNMTIITTMMRKNTTIITTMMRRSTMITITTMMRRNMTTTTIMVRIAPAAATIMTIITITITQMKYLQAGVRKPQRNLQGKKSKRSCRHWRMALMA